MGSHRSPAGPQDEPGSTLTNVPAMPVIQTHETYSGPYDPLASGKRHSIGWQQRDAKKGGACFTVFRTGAMGATKVLDRFPLTEDGWAQAWRALVGLDTGAAEATLARLAEREARTRAAAERAMIDADSVTYLRAVIFLGGYAPGTELTVGKSYDLRFLTDRLAVFPVQASSVLVEIPYSDVEAVDIGGPGLVKSGGGFIGGGLGAAGAVEGMAIAAVLNSLTTQIKIKTLVRIQGPGCELFMLYSKLEPDALRIELSRSLGAIREAQAARADINALRSPSNPESLLDELSRLASMLDKGFLTREEFDHLKAKLIAES